MSPTPSPLARPLFQRVDRRELDYLCILPDGGVRLADPLEARAAQLLDAMAAKAQRIAGQRAQLATATPDDAARYGGLLGSGQAEVEAWDASADERLRIVDQLQRFLDARPAVQTDVPVGGPKDGGPADIVAGVLRQDGDQNPQGSHLSLEPLDTPRIGLFHRLISRLLKGRSQARVAPALQREDVQ